MKKTILKIQNLHASVEGQPILKGLTLTVKEGETHVIMGPNGSGKSTLSKVLAGHPSYSVEKGKIEFFGKNLLKLPAELRAHEGLFLAFQHPVEIAGVTNYDFLRIAYNKKQAFLGKSELDPIQFMLLLNGFIEKLQFNPELLSRNLNDGFSGGEKKRNEILQMLLLAPKLILLDEIDSGLDIDALKIICNNIAENLPSSSSKIIITHAQPILTYLEPTFVHILMAGKIVKTGNADLLQRVQEYGYQSF